MRTIGFSDKMRITTYCYFSYIVCFQILHCIDTAYNGSLDETTCYYGHKWDELQQKCTRCDVGFFGNDCKLRCEYPFYGATCILKCNCTKEKCHFINGCRKHYIEGENNQNSSSKMDTNDKNVKNDTSDSASQKRMSPIMIGIIVLAAIAFFILLSIIYTYIRQFHRHQGLRGDGMYQLNSII